MCGHQVVVLAFVGGLAATLTATAFTQEMDRGTHNALQSHLRAFAAEASRAQGRQVRLDG